MGTAAVIVERTVLIVGEEDIVAARQNARELAKGLGFGPVDQSRIATAVSELTRNVVRYATGGRARSLLHIYGSGVGGGSRYVYRRSVRPILKDARAAARAMRNGQRTNA